jgi:hypothetical protein
MKLIDVRELPSLDTIKGFLYGRDPKTIVLEGGFVTHCAINRSGLDDRYPEILNHRSTDVAEVSLVLKYRDGTKVEATIACLNVQFLDPAPSKETTE